MRNAIWVSLALAAALVTLVGGCPAPSSTTTNANSDAAGNANSASGSNENANGTNVFVGNSSGPDTGSESPGTNTSNANSPGSTATENANANASGGNSNENSVANANSNDNSTDGNANQNVNGGSNNNNNANGNTNGMPAPALAGRWQATIGCTSTQSLNGTPASPNPESITLEITFDADGKLVSLTVVNFADGIDQVAELTNVNDVDTLTADNGGLDANLVVRLQQINYVGSDAEITVGIHYTGQQGALFQNGNGTQVLTVSPSGGSLAYSLDVTYNVNQQSGSLVLQTGEVIECDGTLALVP